MTAPGIVIAGTETGVGKTSVTVGLIRALVERGRVVQPFKVGPDFIDPGHHRAAAGRWSHNLDGWMLGRGTNRELYERHTGEPEPADLAVVEGVMGLYDGFGGGGEAGSTAEMAKWLGLPVVLVVDAWSMARSAAAMVAGYVDFDPELEVAGVIFNRVAGPGHLKMIEEAVEAHLGDRVAVLGGLPRAEAIEVPERHLGLLLAEEGGQGAYAERLARLGEWAGEHLDLAALEREVARGPESSSERNEGAAAPPEEEGREPVRIGVAWDEAFCFYYRDNLDRLQAAGADLVPYSPMRDPFPEGVDGVYLGGGYPELHARELADNVGARRGLRAFAEDGGAVYAECGGLMYLGETLEDEDGEVHGMCGVFPYRTRMGRLRIDYAEVTFEGATPFWREGTTARGHLFHQSEIVEPEEGDDLGLVKGLERSYEVRTRGEEGMREGFVRQNVLASYLHLHFGSRPGLAEGFVEACRS